jgi:hypothetical protein
MQNFLGRDSLGGYCISVLMVCRYYLGRKPEIGYIKTIVRTGGPEAIPTAEDQTPSFSLIWV